MPNYQFCLTLSLKQIVCVGKNIILSQKDFLTCVIDLVFKIINPDIDIKVEVFLKY